MKTLDDVRAKYPHLGVTVYAVTPRQPVVLELITADGKIYTFPGATEAAAIAAAFPDDIETPSAPLTPVPTPTTNVFD